jgi:DNA repair exonuclease SbcCD nuclease subunit
MKRTRTKRQTSIISNSVDAILTTDWHLREDTPKCRVDDFWKGQWEKVQQVSDLQKKYSCPVFHAGDLYHHWKPSPYLLATTISNIPAQFHTIYGQHDLPQHSMELSYKSGIGALEVAGVVTVIKGSWGDSSPGLFTIKDRAVGFWHKFVWDGKKIPWPGCDELTAGQILTKFPKFDLLVTGDHHKPFTAEYKGRILVNAGCLSRQEASYINHRPRVYLYNAESNSVRIHYLNVNENAVSREHLEALQERNLRIESFVSRLSEEWEVASSFEENVERALSSQKMKKQVKELIYKSLEDEQ